MIYISEQKLFLVHVRNIKNSSVEGKTAGQSGYRKQTYSSKVLSSNMYSPKQLHVPFVVGRIAEVEAVGSGQP